VSPAILHLLQGVTAFDPAERIAAAWSDIGVKTSPSGGSRHPIEVYPVVLAVAGIEPGIYHDSVASNSLVLLRPGHLADRMVELATGQSWNRDASAVFFSEIVVDTAAVGVPTPGGGPPDG